MEEFEKLKQLIIDAEADADKFYNKGNGAAGSRLRKTLMAIKTMAHDIRQDVQRVKNESV